MYNNIVVVGSNQSNVVLKILPQEDLLIYFVGETALRGTPGVLSHTLA